MRCHELDELLIAYQDGEAAPAQREFIELHLRTCVACRNRLAADRLVARRIRSLGAQPLPVPLARQHAVLQRTARPARAWYMRPAVLWSTRYLRAPCLDDHVCAPGSVLAGFASAVAALLVVALLVVCVVLFAGHDLPGPVQRLAATSHRPAPSSTVGLRPAAYTLLGPATCAVNNAGLQSAGPTSYFFDPGQPYAGESTTLRVKPSSTFGAVAMAVIIAPFDDRPCVQLRFTALPDGDGSFTTPIGFPFAGDWRITVQFGGHYCWHKESVLPPRISGQGIASVVDPGGDGAYGANPVWWPIASTSWNTSPMPVMVHLVNGYHNPTLAITAVPLDRQRPDVLGYTASLFAQAGADSTYYQVIIQLPAKGSWLLIAHAGTADGAIVMQVH